jgi:hypothetical protein
MTLERSHKKSKSNPSIKKWRKQIQSFKKQARTADYFDLKHKKDWSKHERRQINTFLANYIPQWDLYGTKFLVLWEDLNQTSIYEEEENIEKALQKAIDWYHQTLYFFAVLLPQIAPDPEHFIIFRGLELFEDDDKFIELLKMGEYYEEYEGLGTSWSWNPDTIVDAVGTNPDIRLIAKIDKHNIDWERTMVYNTSYVFGRSEFGGVPENEVKLLEGVEVPVLAVEKVGGKWVRNRHQYMARTTIPIDMTFIA